ncbi:DNA repair protein RecO [Roseicyclus sp.]|uniref:DNA repair protein RecO n=1 Tax=Roseicyclus sp. TaxID=1914329 RepID=UPI003F9FA802
MEWREDGILLAVRRHGESAAILEVFTEGRGRFVGVMPGGASRRMAPVLQPGAQLDATWRARLSEHIGSFRVEPVRSRAADAMDDRLALAGLGAVCALLSFCLPERAPYPALYARSLALLDGLGAERWAEAYLGWEVALLSEMGFGLSLEHCAVTGSSQDLAYVSPRTGRAVSRAGAGEYADRLLPFPPCLAGMPGGSAADLAAALRTTGHFLHNHLAPSLGDRSLPPARQRLVDLLSRAARTGESG